jgi:peroxiredoxin
LRWSLIFFFLFLFSCNSHPVENKANQYRFSHGGKAPEFELTDLDGSIHSLEQHYRGKVILINFWATWCPPCIAEMPALERLVQEYRNAGFEIIGINVDAINKHDEVRKFVKKNSLTFPILLDPKLSIVKEYGVTGFPESFFINRDGTFISVFDPLKQDQLVRIVSDRPWDSTAYMQLINELLEGNS